jgi:hypothetical protein
MVPPMIGFAGAMSMLAKIAGKNCHAPLAAGRARHSVRAEIAPRDERRARSGEPTRVGWFSTPSLNGYENSMFIRFICG